MPGFRVAIQPDDFGEGNASSPIWTELLEQGGHHVCEVNVRASDIIEQIQGCDAFMWRFGLTTNDLQICRRLMPMIERELGLAVYPDQKTCWHYDDKIVQNWLFQKHDIATPRTWIWFEREPALEWASKASYPFVAKLSGGASADNVILINEFAEAKALIERMFGTGVRSFRPARTPLGRTRLKKSAKVCAKGLADTFRLLFNGATPDPEPSDENYWALNRNYVYFQEFLPGNDYDTRVTVIGNRAFGYRRNNRPGDFRASGGNRPDYDPKGIAPEFVALAFEAARKLQTQSCATDGLWRDGKPVIGEISYAYVSHMVHSCHGYWDPELNWHEGHMWPEEAQIEDFLVRLEERRARA